MKETTSVAGEIRGGSPAPLLPALSWPSFLHVDFAVLAQAGARYLILDVDNTVAYNRAPRLVPGVAEHLARARQEGHLADVCLVSNVLMGRRRRERVERFAAELQAHCVAAGWLQRKPSPTPFRAALRLMGCRPEETAVVGDQLFTDVLGGNRLGMLTVWVPPLGPDHWTTGLTLRRLRERRILVAAGLAPVGLSTATREPVEKVGTPTNFLGKPVTDPGSRSRGNW